MFYKRNFYYNKHYKNWCCLISVSKNGCFHIFLTSTEGCLFSSKHLVHKDIIISLIGENEKHFLSGNLILRKCRIVSHLQGLAKGGLQFWVHKTQLLFF